MTQNVLLTIKDLKKKAKLLRDIADYGRALVTMQQGIDLLEGAKESSLTSTETEQLHSELADCWGMKGGIHRRAGELEQALAAYLRGCEFEKDDSYNLVNSIVVELLIHPDRLGALLPRIETARTEVERQIRSHRSGQWWAWADLGLLGLLLDDLADAEQAYRQFTRTGARPSDYDSAISVLEQLAEKFAGGSEPARARLDRGIALLRRLKA
jgi:tetratricopeptide (TPR) repeat protein